MNKHISHNSHIHIRFGYTSARQATAKRDESNTKTEKRSEWPYLQQQETTLSIAPILAAAIA